MDTKRKDIVKDNRIFIWLALLTGTLLLIPLIGEWPWSPSDFVIMGALIFGFGSLFVLLARKIERKYRLVVGGVVLLAFLWLWAELAVGVFTSWGS